ncbi:MAG: beta-propeller fold lactonase family protein [Phycisphaerae bacterium]|nr:beta-propeller fold lactonase family protein [Phycisphaerae bacterium]
MRQATAKRVLWGCLVLGMVCGTAQSADYLSPISVVAGKGGDVLYVAEATAGQVAVFDTAAGKVSRTITVSQRPTGLALSADGKTLYVTSATVPGKVDVVDIAAGKVVRSIAAGHTPMDVVVSPDGATLYVCNQFNNNVGVIDLASGKQTATVAVLREPMAAAVTGDGKYLFVVNHLPAGAADADYAAAAVSVVDTAQKKAVKHLQLPNGSMGARGIAMSPDGKHAYVTHVLGRYQLPTTQLERGWMNTNALTIIDVAGQKVVNTVLVDDVDLGAANPHGVVCTADGKTIVVTHAGTHEVSVIDRAALHEKLAKVAAGQKVSDASSSADDVPNDLAFLVGLRRRLKLAGNGPRGVAVVGTKVYAAEYFSDSLGVIDIGSSVRPRAASIPLGDKVALTERRTGEMLFSDATMCFQYWQSCASCHPGEARVDALNWDLMNDGLGNPKNTKSMLVAHKTPPAMVSGVRGNAEAAVRSGIRFILFAVRPEAEAVAIDTYLKSLEPVPSPYLVDGKLSESARRGEKVFKDAGCARCHPSPLYTNLQKYDVGLGLGREDGMEFDTPTLVEVWRTAPYLHDGRATTIGEVLTRFNKDDKHGETSKLSDKDLADLIEFVMSL